MTRLGLLFTALSLLACSEGTTRDRTPCSGTAAQAIYYGQDSPEALDASTAELLAVGGLEDSTGTTLCSATLIAPGWVLTARHCASLGDLWFRTEFAGVRVRAFAARHHDHPERDIALLELSIEPDQPLDRLRPIEPWNAEVDATWVGRRVTLAGLGATEHGTRGDRRFVEEPITQVTDDYIEVNGAGRKGACGGDSGGPLLFRDPTSEQIRTLGVLSVGDSSCLGRDRYVRSDANTTWIGEVLAAAPSRAPCH